jgi:GTPase
LSKPIIAIVGRQNVGKSTLLNRVAGKPIAIVQDFPGTTRDRIFADASWNGTEFILVDTGGLEFKDNSDLAQGVRKQAETAIAEADVILFVADAKEGMTPADVDIANILRRTDKPVLLIVNKVDNDKQLLETAEFHRLGIGEPYPVSAYHGRWISDMLDKMVRLLPAQQVTEETITSGVKVAIVGRPHVGKSLLLNRLLGKERSIIGSMPGTTRDAIDTQFSFENQNIILIDTAGIRRRGKVEQGIEWYSVLRAMQAIDRSDIALLLIDATEPLAAQDAHIAGYVEKAGKGIVILVNKWDLATEKNKTVYDEYISSRLKFAPWAPIVYISAKTGQGVNKIMPLVVQVNEERSMRIPNKEIDNLIKEAVESHVRPHKGNKILKIYSASQTGTNPPSFQFMVNDTRLIHFSYERFLENRLREIYSFKGTPIRLGFKTRG